MLDNLQKKLQQILTNMNPETLQKGFKTVSDIMNTPEGQKLAEQIKNIDKDTLMKQLSQMDKNQVNDKLEKMDVDQITNKMNNMDGDRLVKELTNNPDLIKKLNDFINNNE